MEMPETKPETYTEEGKAFKERCSAIIKKDRIVINDRIADFVQNTLWKRPDRDDLLNYEAYHVIVGSTPQEKLDLFDLEGDESIVQFIERLENEVEGPEEK